MRSFWRVCVPGVDRYACRNKGQFEIGPFPSITLPPSLSLLRQGYEGTSYGGQAGQALNWVCFFGEVKLRYIILEHREHLFGNRNSKL
jgi:hypothetical protein